MIFITLGTQKFQFDRVLKEIDKLIEEGKLKKEDLQVQCVFSEYVPKNFETFDLKPQNEIDELIDKAEIIITHSGTGSIIGALKKKKKLIIIPRLKKYGEHVDNHQMELAELFNEKFNIPIVLDVKDLYDNINKMEDFIPVKWEEDNKRLIKDVESKINQLL